MTWKTYVKQDIWAPKYACFNCIHNMKQQIGHNVIDDTVEAHSCVDNSEIHL